ncbi:MAG: hypothetical protein ACFFCS_18540, partial [Candidatus Hodarchaeota archaeon]
MKQSIEKYKEKFHTKMPEYEIKAILDRARGPWDLRDKQLEKMVDLGLCKGLGAMYCERHVIKSFQEACNIRNVYKKNAGLIEFFFRFHELPVKPWIRRFKFFCQKDY